MVAEFTEYNYAKGFWFNVMLAIGKIVSENPELSANSEPTVPAKHAFEQETIEFFDWYYAQRGSYYS